MSRKSTSIIAVSIFFLLTVLSLGIPKSALAAESPSDNDDFRLGVCDITIGGTSVNPFSNAKVFPNRTNGSEKIFDIKICPLSVLGNKVEGVQNQAPNSCLINGARKLVANVHTAGLINRWKEIALTPDGSGCYTGVLIGEVGLGPQFDVELNEASGGSACYSKMPVCRRVNPTFSLNGTAEQEKECSDLVKSFENCSFLQPLPARVNYGDIVTISGIMPELNKPECKEGNLSTPKLGIYFPEAPPGEEVMAKQPKFGEAFSYSFNTNESTTGRHRLTIYTEANAGKTFAISYKCTTYFNVCDPDEASCESGFVVPGERGSQPFKLCNQVSSVVQTGSTVSQKDRCISCLGSEDSPEGIWTAVGCIKTEPQAIIQTVVRIGISIGGGIALLMTLVGGFMLTTSQGDPKRVQEGKEMITSSVIGIIFVLFSVVILQFIGVTILRLPGFGT
ncbi:hypothetical protein KA012_00105 [Candidatus Woesebacteria bacterium]|nr:hypothetical protein [Candidatus Woesebacteria bacterium]